VKKYYTMASVDLTRIFLQLRNNCGNTNINFADDDENDDAALISNKSSSAIIASTPVWTTGIDLITQTLKKSQQALSQQKQLHEAILAKPLSFDGSAPQSSQQTQEQIQRTEQLTSNIRFVEKKLKSFNKWRKDNQKKISHREYVIMENISNSLADQLQTLTSNFSKQQNNFTDRLKKKNHGPKMSSGNAFSLNATTSGQHLVDEIVDSEQPSLDQVQRTMQLNEEIEDREESITSVTKDIYELNRLFKEVAGMVIEQGSILDRIDYNIEVTADRVEQGHEELTKAREAQKKNKKLLIIMIEAGIVIFLFMILAWRLS